MKKRFITKVAIVVLLTFTFQVFYIHSILAQPKVKAKPGDKLIVSSGLRKAAVNVRADCKGIYDKKLNQLKRKLENERKQIEKDFIQNKQALKKRRAELKARYKALGNIFDPASSLRHKCDAISKKIDKYQSEIRYYVEQRQFLAGLGRTEERDKKFAKYGAEMALLSEARERALKQWKDCLAKLKEAGSFKQRLERENRALSKLADTTVQNYDLEQEKKKTLDRLSKDYERRKGWLQESRNYCKKTGEWPVETASCLSKSCAGNFKDAFQALQHTLQTKRKLKKQLLKMQRGLDRQWDKVAVEMRDKMMSLEGSVGIVTVKAMGNFLFAFGLDRVDDFIGLQVEKGTAKYFPAGDEGKKVLQKIVGTGMRKGVQRITIEVIKKLPSKTNAILSGLKKLDQSEEEAGAYRVSDKQPPPEDIAKGIAKRIPGGLKDALLGRYPILIAGDVLGPNQVRLSPIKLSEFKEKFPSIAALDETYGKIFKLLKQLSALSAEEEGLWRKLINISSCIKPQCNLIPAATQKLDIGITQKDLDRAGKHAFGERHGPLYSQRSKIQRLKMVARGFECDLCKALQILKEVREVSDITRANIKTLNILILRNQRTILSLNLDLYKILTRPGALKGSLWGYYDYLSTAMTFLPNGGAAVAFAEGIVSVADQYMKEGSRPAHDTWANIKRVSVFQASNAWLLDKWTRFGNSLNAFQEDIIRRILANCLDDICSEEKVAQATSQVKDITIGGQKKGKKSLEEVDLVVDLTGCWESVTGTQKTITIWQKNRKASATVSRYGNRVFTGLFQNNELRLRYQLKNLADYASLPWGEDGPSQKALQKALLVQVSSDFGFDMKLTGDGMLKGNYLALYVKWDKGNGELLKTYPGSIPELWKKKEIEAKSLTVTDASFTNHLEIVKPGDRIWVKANAASGCPDIRDHFEVTIYPMGQRGSAISVMLEETGPDTLEFRSPAEGILVANVFEKKEKEDKNKAMKPLKAKEEAGAEKSKKPEKGSAKREKAVSSGHKEKQEIIEVGAQGGKKKAGFKTALNRNTVKLIAEKKWLEKELKNRKEKLNNLGQAKTLFIRHYSMQPFPHNKGGLKGGVRKLARLETTENPELSEQGFKLDKTESVLFMRKAKEHLNKEIGRIETDLKRIMKELIPSVP